VNCSEANSHTDLWAQLLDSASSEVPQDLLSAAASQAYVERVTEVCGDLAAGKQNRLTKKQTVANCSDSERAMNSNVV